jgi:hypothetical protein
MCQDFHQQGTRMVYRRSDVSADCAKSSHPNGQSPEEIFIKLVLYPLYVVEG